MAAKAAYLAKGSVLGSGGGGAEHKAQAGVWKKNGTIRPDIGMATVAAKLTLSGGAAAAGEENDRRAAFPTLPAL